MERLTFKAGGFNAFNNKGLCTYGGMQKDGSVIYIGDIADKLAEYEDLEEQGLLLKLPCKVGDTFYTIIESKVLHLRFDDCKKNPYAGGIDLYCINVKNRCDYRWIHLPCEKFYGTQTEAEEALKRMEENK